MTIIIHMNTPTTTRTWWCWWQRCGSMTIIVTIHTIRRLGRWHSLVGQFDPRCWMDKSGTSPYSNMMCVCRALDALRRESRFVILTRLNEEMPVTNTCIFLIFNNYFNHVIYNVYIDDRSSEIMVVHHHAMNLTDWYICKMPYSFFQNWLLRFMQ